MPYTFELTFTGLCIFTFKGDKRRPDEVNVLLVGVEDHGHGHNAANPNPDVHLPILSYNPLTIGGDRDNPTPPHFLVPGPDGSQIAFQNLASKEVLDIVLPDGVDAPLSAKWRPESIPNLPQCPADPKVFGESSDEQLQDREEWLDWVMALQRMNKETPDPKSNEAPLAGLKDKVIARVCLKQGALKARGFRREKNGNYAIWDFKVPAEEPIAASHAMAQSVVLTVSGIPNHEPVKILSRPPKSQLKSRLKVSLLPPSNSDGTFTGPLRASVTHLPNGEDPPPPRNFLRHHAHFYDLVDFKPPAPRLRLPHRLGGIITSGSSYCPPTTHTLKE